MKKYVERQVIIQGIETIVCNKCGKNIQLDEWVATEGSEEPFFTDYQSFELLFGYGSKYDGLKMKFDLCDNCVSEFIETFKIKPEEFVSFFGE